MEEGAQIFLQLLGHGVSSQASNTPLVPTPFLKLASARDVPLSAAVRMATEKARRYTDVYDIPEADLVMLVFETYGGCAPSTLQFLKRVSEAIAGNDAELAGKIFRGVRDRISIALHKRHCAIIAQLNSLNAAFAR